jgi:hypothetical protein
MDVDEHCQNARCMIPEHLAANNCLSVCSLHKQYRTGRNNCASCAVATDRFLSGGAHEVADFTGVSSTRLLEWLYGRKFVTRLTLEQLATQLPTNGSRGIIFGSRGSRRGGHFVNGINHPALQDILEKIRSKTRRRAGTGTRIVVNDHISGRFHELLTGLDRSRTP